MRRPATFCVTFALTAFASVGPRAQGLADVRFEAFADDEKTIIDRIAADFFEQDLRPAQSEAIEQRTSALYREAEADERRRMLAERRADWRALSDRRRDALMSANRPRYDNLTDAQKAPFRSHAIDRLGGAGAIDDAALEDAMNSGI